MADDPSSKTFRVLSVDLQRLRVDPAFQDHLKSYIESPAIRSLQASIVSNQRVLDAIVSPALKYLVADTQRYRAMVEPMRLEASALCRFAETERLRFSAVDLARLTETRTQLADMAAVRAADIHRFALPSLAALTDHYRHLTVEQLLPTTRLMGLEASALEAAAGLRRPGLDQANAIASMSSFTELRSIGKAISLPDAYSDTVSEALRSSLGDWRDGVSGDPEALRGLSDRTALYLERGLNPDLTDFPEEAFEEGLDASEIRGEPPPLLVVYEAPVPGQGDDELEAGFLRNNKAHDWLQRFETQIRRFIDEHMTAQYGADWPRSKLPNNMYDRWIDKQARDPHRDRHTRLIVYADFTDYEPLITRSDVFRDVFRPFFGRVESFRESMFRLSLPRVEVSHARIITQDEALLFYAELKRLAMQFARIH